MVESKLKGSPLGGNSLANKDSVDEEEQVPLVNPKEGIDFDQNANLEENSNRKYDLVHKKEEYDASKSLNDADFKVPMESHINNLDNYNIPFF